MKRISLVLAVTLTSAGLLAQKKPIQEIENLVTRTEVEAPLTFLAADEMRGRDTGSRELDIAANYIASNFHALGLKTLPGADKYFQAVDLVRTEPFTNGEVKLGADVFSLKEHFVVLDGASADWNGEFVYVGYGAAEEMPSDVKGKVVVAIAGAQGAKGVNEIYIASMEKFERVKAAGAAGLIEYFVVVPFPWPAV